MRAIHSLALALGLTLILVSSVDASSDEISDSERLQVRLHLENILSHIGSSGMYIRSAWNALMLNDETAFRMFMQLASRESKGVTTSWESIRSIGFKDGQSRFPIPGEWFLHSVVLGLAGGSPAVLPDNLAEERNIRCFGPPFIDWQSPVYNYWSRLEECEYPLMSALFRLNEARSVIMCLLSRGDVYKTNFYCAMLMDKGLYGPRLWSYDYYAIIGYGTPLAKAYGLP